MEVGLKTLSDFSTLCEGVGWAMFFVTVIIFLTYFGMRKEEGKNKCRIEGGKIVDIEYPNSKRPPDPKPLGKRIITEGKMIKGGINRIQMMERPNTSPPDLNLRKK